MAFTNTRELISYLSQDSALRGKRPNRWDLYDAANADAAARYKMAVQRRAQALDEKKAEDQKEQFEKNLGWLKESQANTINWDKEKLAQQMALELEKMGMTKELAMFTAEQEMARMVAQQEHQTNLQKWVTGENTKLEREKMSTLKEKQDADIATAKQQMALNEKVANENASNARFTKYSGVVTPIAAAIAGAAFRGGDRGEPSPFSQWLDSDNRYWNRDKAEGRAQLDSGDGVRSLEGEREKYFRNWKPRGDNSEDSGDVVLTETPADQETSTTKAEPTTDMPTMVTGDTGWSLGEWDPSQYLTSPGVSGYWEPVGYSSGNGGWSVDEFDPSISVPSSGLSNYDIVYGNYDTNYSDPNNYDDYNFDATYDDWPSSSYDPSWDIY